MKSILEWHQDLIQIFVAYFQYQICNNNPIGDNWKNVDNEKFNEFCIIYYDAFSRLCKAVLANTIPTPTTSTFKSYPKAENFNK